MVTHTSRHFYFLHFISVKTRFIKNELSGCCRKPFYSGLIGTSINRLWRETNMLPDNVILIHIRWYKHIHCVICIMTYVSKQGSSFMAFYVIKNNTPVAIKLFRFAPV